MQKVKKANSTSKPKIGGFERFFKTEMELIYMLELKTTEMIRKLHYVIEYSPLRKAIDEYLDGAIGHITSLRSFGIRTNRVSIDNKKTTELLIHPLFRSLDAIGNQVKVKEIALITGIQRIIFYQIAIYRSLCTAAKKIQKNQWAEAFNDMLEEKQINDNLLSEVALSGIYSAAIRE